MNKKTWTIFVIAVVVIFGGLILLARLGNPAIDVSKINQNSVLAASKASGNIADHVFGKTDSKVVLIEYGDFQCPACGAAYPQVKAVTSEYQNQITYVFRNFPLTTLHPNAQAAAAAAEAAGLQGKYWQMHDKLYETQNDWSSDSPAQRGDAFQNYAISLGLNPTKFSDDLNNSNSGILQKIRFDQALGNKQGVDATPTLVLDGKVLNDQLGSDLTSGNGDKLRQLINAELKKNGIALPAGEK